MLATIPLDPAAACDDMISLASKHDSVVIAAVLFVLCFPVSAHAQQTGELSGSIYDQTGAPLPGVASTLRGVTDRETQTSAAGDFAFRDLPQGDYEISAELTGFERSASCRASAGGRAGHRVPHPARRHRRRNDRHRREGGRARCSGRFPMAISAVSNAELARLGTQTLGEAAALAPSVTFSQNVGFGQLTIRGIGTNVLFAGSDPSSAMYLDGVYLARPAMAFVQFLDLDRIEVLRGPQGTLYGRNAVGGAMNLIPSSRRTTFKRPPISRPGTSGSFAATRGSAVRSNATE